MYNKLIHVINNNPNTDEGPGGNVFLTVGGLRIHYSVNNNLIDVVDQRNNNRVFRAFPDRVVHEVSGPWVDIIDRLFNPPKSKNAEDMENEVLSAVSSVIAENVCPKKEELLQALSAEESNPETVEKDLTEEELEALLQAEQDALTLDEADSLPQEF